MITSLASVSAWTKTYDQSTQTILIESDAGSDLLSISLIDNTYFCLENCHATLRFDVLVDGLSSPLSTFKIKKWINNQWQDGTLESLSFSHNTSGEWQPLTLAQFNYGLAHSGTYYVRIDGKKQANEVVDWIPSFFSSTLDLDEWALWSGGDVVNYWDLNETSGPVIDLMGNNNGTNYGATPGEAGILENAYLFNGTSQVINTSTAISISGAQNRTVNYWINLTSLPAECFSFWMGIEGSTGHAFANKFASSDGSLFFTGWGTADYDTGVNLNANVWNMITTTYDGTVVRTYVNGVETPTSNQAKSLSTDSAVFAINNRKVGAGGCPAVVDEVMIKNQVMNSTEIATLYNSGTYLGYAGGEPLVTLTSPNDGSSALYGSPTVFTFNAQTSPILNLVNATLYLNSTLNETIPLSGYIDSDSFSKYLEAGNHTWYIEICDDGGYCSTSVTRSLLVQDTGFLEYYYNPSVYDTSQQNFTIEIQYNSDTYSTVTGKLEYNGTNYTATKEGTGSIINFTKILDIPEVSSQQDRNFTWYITLGGVKTVKSAIKTQEVNQTVFTYCGASYSDVFLNISFLDEGNSSAIKASIPYSIFNYSIGGTIIKSYTYTNSTDNYEYNFCSNVGNNNLVLNPYVQYKNDDHPQRIYDPSSLQTNTNQTNVTLYLLSTSEGQYVTFQVVDLAQNIISGVDSNVSREIGGSEVILGQGITDAAGTVTFWLSPDFVHTISFSKSGYTSFSSSLTPTQTSYTITLGGGITSAPVSYFKGMTWSLLPTNTSLNNDTTYTFGFLLDSSVWTLDEYGFNLRFSNGTIISGGTTSTSGTQLTLDYDVNNLSIIYLDYFWKLDGVYTNLTTSWKIYNTLNTQWSIKAFFTDLNTYLDSGIFGLDNFGRYILIFLLIFLPFGIVTYKFGINNPVMVTFILFAIIFFLDVVEGLIPTITFLNDSQVPYVFTFLAALIMVIMIIKEAQT